MFLMEHVSPRQKFPYLLNKINVIRETQLFLLLTGFHVKHLAIFYVFYRNILILQRILAKRVLKDSFLMCPLYPLPTQLSPFLIKSLIYKIYLKDTGFCGQAQFFAKNLHDPDSRRRAPSCTKYTVFCAPGKSRTCNDRFEGGYDIHFTTGAIYLLYIIIYFCHSILIFQAFYTRIAK